MTDSGGSATFFRYWSRSRGRCFIGERSQDGDGHRTAVRRALDVAGGSARRLAAVLLAGLVLAFGATSAEAVPSVSFKCTPAPQDCSGWYRSNVSIDWTVLPSGSVVAGCQDKTYTTDTAGTSEYCSADDGTATVTVELNIRVDKTPPVVTGGQPSRAADVNGWYNRPVAITFSGSDQTSGIGACTSTTYAGPDSTAASVAGTCTDKAGNVSAPLGYGLKYDATGPVVSGAAPERSPTADGWFNRPVRFDIRGTDATSGIADCPAVTYSGPDSASASFSGSCGDQAGNVSTRAFGLKYDATPPEVTGATPDHPANSSGWFNSPVRFDIDGSDQTSGIADCTSFTYGGPDSASASFSGSCRDQAGNASSRAFALKYDATPPAVMSAQAARAPDAGGWYNHPVEIGFTGSDETSGIQACTAASYAGPDSATASVRGSCSDMAGNQSGPLDFGLKYDATAPVVSGAAPERPPDHAGWFSRPVRFDVTGTDATSGLAECPSVAYAGPDSATASVNAGCRDQAGNFATHLFALKYDATPPVLSDLRAAGLNRGVALSWRASADTESVEVVRTPGVGDEPATTVFRGLAASFVDGRVANGVRYTYEARALDAAGNGVSQTVVGVPVGTGADAAPPGPTAPARRRARYRRPRLLAPRLGTIVRPGRPPLLRWTPVRRARYYNVQLWRRGAKILSAWPARPRHQLKRRWKYGGRSWRLEPGRYRWFVWPGFGPRSKADYGRRMGPGRFEVRRGGSTAAVSADALQ